MLSDEPDAPGKPQITDWDKDHVDLQWPAPSSDGGSPITEYIVQKKEKGSPYWVNAIHVPPSQTNTTVPDLTEGQEYEFRVIAVNAAGQSEPSEPSDLVTAKPRYREHNFTSFVLIYSSMFTVFYPTILIFQWLQRSRRLCKIFESRLVLSSTWISILSVNQLRKSFGPLVAGNWKATRERPLPL